MTTPRRRAATVAAALLPLVTAQLLLPTAPAHASGAGTVWVSGAKLFYAAAPGTAGSVMIDLVGGVFHVSAPPGTVTAGNGCVQAGAQAQCPVGKVTIVDADTGDLADTLGVRGTLAAADLTVVADGGSGNDALWVDIDGAGKLIGGDGHDTLDGSGGPDLLMGGAGQDALFGHGGNDTLVGGLGNDVMSGGPGTDLVSYADHPQAVFADADGVRGDDGAAGEQDTILADVEKLRGSRHADHLAGTGAADELSGGDGDDTLVGNDGGDLLDGEAGRDRLFGDGGTPGGHLGGVDVCRAGPDAGVAYDCEVLG